MFNNYSGWRKFYDALFKKQRSFTLHNSTYFKHIPVVAKKFNNDRNRYLFKTPNPKKTKIRNRLSGCRMGI